VSEVDRQRVLVVDFGAQYGQLIARRVRDLQVFSELVPCDIDPAELKADPPAAIILSGGPASVYASHAPELNPRLLELGVPVLGLCYGMQAMAQTLGGTVAHTDVAEYGPAELSVTADGSSSLLLKDTPQTQTVWMSHRDAVSEVPAGFAATALTPTTAIAAMECAERGLYATQFHPEVHHTVHGTAMLSHFLFDVAGLTPSWTMTNISEAAIAQVREQVGSSRVILGLSGGVDSSVVAALLSRAIGRQLTCVFVDNGLLRKNEPEEVRQVFTTQFDLDFVQVDAEERYLEALAGVTDPEKKRRIIGTLFWQIFFEEAERIAERTGEPVKYLAQGTIYPDVIESGASRGGAVTAVDGSATTGSEQASTIKSHHNMVPFPEGVHFELIEPLRNLFKDEVRALGATLGLPDTLVYRQPFPGPGLAVRIIGDVTREKLATLKDADAIVREELDAYNRQLFEATGLRDSERSVWQYFAVLPDIRSVGVMGDERTYEHPIILRAVESRDAMTADWARLPYDVLASISSRIVAEVEGINRVVYDITSKPPGTIEWE
jgi:GMP synthase (glutamine-hydrolysing)